MDSKSNFDEVLFTIGPYQISKSIGKGGMGEVFLAYDPRCSRRVALKRIRPDLETNPNLRAYFLYEAHLTGLMSHPSIVPIFDIVEEDGLTFYTMPYLEGITLDNLISLAQQQEKEGQPLDIRATVPVLLHSFLSVCHAIFYAHSKGVIHRDLKPSNIMICLNGEAVILDWGVAQIIKSNGHTADSKTDQEWKEVEKVIGTVGYLAPEQTFGQNADFSTEIYALGMILYEILTLRPPFHRENLDQYRYNLTFEVLPDPARVAPHRGISPILSMITLKCLSSVPEDRYQSIDALLLDLENYLKRHTHWFKVAEFDQHHTLAWEASKECNPLEKRLEALSKSCNVGTPLLISKKSFADLVKITLRIKLAPHSPGIGFFLGIPNAETCPQCQCGYCLWLASEETKATRLFCLPDKEISMQSLFLTPGICHDIQIEKIENTLNFYLDQRLQFTYVNHVPLHHTHIGILLPNEECIIEDGQIFIGGNSFSPNPLAVANAFFAHHYFVEALNEYRQVATQYPFTIEGRKAAFRAGVTLLEYQRYNKQMVESAACEQEFQKLSDPVSAPLSLLGQALVFQYKQDYSGELICFETAYDRYAHHSFIYLWHNQLLTRLLESPLFTDEILYRYLLLAMRYLPQNLLIPHVHYLLDSRKEISEPLYFLNDQRAAIWPAELWRISKCIRLAFWLAAPDVLAKIVDNELQGPKQHLNLIANALCALLELGAYEIVAHKLEAIYEVMLDVQAMVNFDWIHEAVLIHHTDAATLSESLLSILPSTLNKQSMRVITHILFEALYRKQTDHLHDSISLLDENYTIPDEYKQALMCCRIWAYLLDKEWVAAEDLLARLNPLLQIDLASLSPPFLKGCWLAAVQGNEAALQYFSDLLKANPLALGKLFGQFIQNELPPNVLFQAFMWDKRQLFCQAALYFHCLEDEKAACHYRTLESQEYL